MSKELDEKSELEKYTDLVKQHRATKPKTRGKVMNNALATTEPDRLPIDVQPQSGAVVALNPETLIAKAIEANMPVESLERLLAMRAELKREQSMAAFNYALAEFQSDIPPILKTKTAAAGGRFTYRYADGATIQRAIAPRLRECGLSVTFDTRQDGDTLHVGCIVRHAEGHSERTEFPVPIDRQARMNDTQKVGSALTYGRRYALCAALGIVTAEDDDDGRAAGSSPASAPATPPAPAQQPRMISELQRRRLEARITELGLDRERVKAWIARAWRVEHFRDIPADKYSELDQHLNAWTAQQQEERQQADARRSRALEEAGRWGWSGAMSELPGVAEKMRQRAKSDRTAAQYLDRGHGEEILRIEAVERTAAELERAYAEHSETETKQEELEA